MRLSQHVSAYIRRLDKAAQLLPTLTVCVSALIHSRPGC